LGGQGKEPTVHSTSVCRALSSQCEVELVSERKHLTHVKKKKKKKNFSRI